ncbi:MAG: altronate dehydratase, partial [Rhodobacteraceae bacterium]|nr:altronate dehydratase [Paracoccaceae bacterium]
MDFIRLDPSDNVVTATHALETGTIVEDLCTKGLIPSGHKIATKAIDRGAEVRKYAQLIGYASQNIAAGDHVHTHNVAFRNIDMAYEYCNDLRHVQKVTNDRRDSFMGFRRENGTVGTRNYIAVVTSVNCSATAARMIASA